MVYTLCWIEEEYSQADRKTYRKRSWLSFQNLDDIYEFISTNGIEDWKIVVDFKEVERIKNEKLVLETQLEAIKNTIEKILK